MSAARTMNAARSNWPGLGTFRSLLAGLWLCIAVAEPAAAVSPALSGGVFLPEQANEARQVAQRACKPLVVHVVPNARVGMEEVVGFYQPGGELPREVLDRVVIVILPRDRYWKFAAELGINDAGGMRTLSPYSLDTLDAGSVTTCRAGFI